MVASRDWLAISSSYWNPKCAILGMAKLNQGLADNPLIGGH